MADGESKRGVVRALPVQFATDEALVTAALQRHPASARVLWNKYSTLVRGLLRRMLGSTSAVEDHVQDVFLRLFKDMGRLREPSKLRSFIVGITMRVARSELRQRRARSWLRFERDEQLPQPAQPPTDFGAAEAWARLECILARLDARSREVFVLRHVEGLSLNEVADALGCSIATVKRRDSKAKQRINAAVERDPALAEYAGKREKS